MDADIEQIHAAKDIGADRIELYTGPYADAKDPHNVFEDFQEAAKTAQQLGLGINAGHDLNLQNLPLFATLYGLQEVSIGHALTIDALTMGLEKTVRAYLDCLQ